MDILHYLSMLAALIASVVIGFRAYSKTVALCVELSDVVKKLSIENTRLTEQLSNLNAQEIELIKQDN